MEPSTSIPSAIAMPPSDIRFAESPAQPGKLWRLMTPADQQATCENTARAMGDSELFIKQRHVRNCYNADPSYGEGVARALGISLAEALTAEDPAHPAWDKR